MKSDNTKKNSKKKYSANKKSDRIKETSKSMPTSGKSAAITNIINASASVAVRNVAGNPITVDVAQSATGFNTSSTPITIPGVVSMLFNPVFGTARGSQTDPVNLAARNMWMNLRSLYSNRIPYTAGAIVMYSMALDSILMAYQVIKRAYGVVFAYDARNRYIPDGLLLAMGIDPVDFRANLPQIRTFLNKVATQFTAFGVPTELRFIIDHVDMCSHVYMDGASANSQYIVPMPAFVWKMNWTENKLERWDVTHVGVSNPTKWKDIESNMTGLVEAFVNNEDVYMIASDMMRLYGNLAMLTPVEDNYMIGPEYSEEFLSILHNATFAGISQAYNDHIPSKPVWEVSELQAPENVGAIAANYSTGFDLTLYTDQTTNMNNFAAISPGIFDFHNSEPTTDDIVRAANWKYSIKFVERKAKEFTIRIETCGTFILDRLLLVTMRNDIHNPDLRVYDWVEIDPLPGDAYPSSMLTALAVIKDHPFLPVFDCRVTISKDIASVGTTINGYIGDYDQYVTLDIEEISRIHTAIILDKFDAAGIGTLNLHTK